MQPTGLYSFGTRLRALRVARELSQAQVARLVGRHQTAIGPYERDEYMPARDVVEKLASILETSPEYLIFGRSAHRTQIPLTGRVQAGTLVEEELRTGETAMLSFRDEQITAFDVADASMVPVFAPGQILLVSAITDAAVDAHVGRYVLAALRDGRVMLRLLLPSRERERWDLAACAGPTLQAMSLNGVRPVFGALDRSAFATGDATKS